MDDKVVVRLGKRSRALLEICLMVFIAVLIMWLFEAYLKWLMFWDWYAKALIILIALLAVVLPRRSLRAYGFLPKNSRFTAKWCILIILIFVLPAVVSVIISMILGVARFDKLSPLRVILSVIYCIVILGLVEESYFRGYVQSRLEEAFGKRWKKLVFRSWRVDYGVGMIIASALFGIVHIVNYWNPIIPRWEPSWGIPIHILGAFAFGCLAGVLREASGDIYVPASLHGGIMIAYTFLSYTNIIALNIALFIAWFIFFYTIDFFFREAEKIKTV